MVIKDYIITRAKYADHDRKSSFGAIEAAEAHLGALETLMEKLGPDGWQMRECGLVQRVALL